VLYVAGAWRLYSVPALRQSLNALRLPDAGRLVLDGSSLHSMDTAGAFVLFDRLCELGCAASAIRERHFDPKYGRLLALVRQRIATPHGESRSLRRGPLARMGAATIQLGGLLARDLAFAGSVTLELLKVLRRPALFRIRETAAQFETVCIDAIPIVALINFLIGVVVAYVLGIEAQRYGADLFVADGVAIAVCRELSPILGSVLVAGRSGAAFTAHIGTMKVSEEVDAIATLGLSPLQVLVIPRLVALVAAMPLLVLVGDIAGNLGGMLVCALQLHIVPETYVDRIHAVLQMSHFVAGIGKAPVFAVFIALIACRMGLQVKRDARSVGENTTSTVVQCIVWVFVLDALFAVLLQYLNV
jgi:phospholipid/cholesterol/gamma-HCH transport system permease protein